MTLTLIVLLPLLAAVLLAFVPSNYRFVMRLVALGVTFVTAVLSVSLFFSFRLSDPGYQFLGEVPWLGLDSLGIRCRFGVDGISLGLVVMGAIVAFAATCASWEIKDREKEYYILLLTMIGGILGAFASTDLFFFYFFHELALVPTFIMIGVWGRGQDKGYAAFKMTIYLSLGALVALGGLIALYVASGTGTFDLEQMGAQLRVRPVAGATQKWIFPLLMFGFGVLVSLWPLHTWAPLGYGAAPTATAMLHAGVLKKFGLYGLIRVALPMLPDGSREWLDLLVALALGNILYCGLVAIRQKDLNLLIGNSSVAHMGFIFLGIASLTVVGVSGAVVVMVAHGLLAALTFGLSGYLHNATGTLEIARFGGLLQRLPFIGSLLVMAMMAGCGLPGFANFVGEAMVFFGSWKAYPLATAAACWGGLVIGAVYMLRAIRNILHGPLLVELEKVQDAPHIWRRLPFLVLVAALLVLGIWPRLLTDRIEPSVKRMIAASTLTSKQAAVVVPTAPAAAAGNGTGTLHGEPTLANR